MRFMELEVEDGVAGVSLSEPAKPNQCEMLHLRKIMFQRQDQPQHYSHDAQGSTKPHTCIRAVIRKRERVKEWWGADK